MILICGQLEFKPTFLQTTVLNMAFVDKLYSQAHNNMTTRQLPGPALPEYSHIIRPSCTFVSFGSIFNKLSRTGV